MSKYWSQVLLSECISISPAALVETACFNLLQQFHIYDEIFLFFYPPMCGCAKESFSASLWVTWQQCIPGLLFITKVIPIRPGVAPCPSLHRHYVNRNLAGLHVLYLITDRASHLGHQSEYLNTYKIGFSLTASLRLIKFGPPEHRYSVKRIMHLP